jgi:outer membrane protease
MPARRRVRLEAAVAGAWVDGASYERVYDRIAYGRLAGRTHKLSELVWDIRDVYGVRGTIALMTWDERLEFRATLFSAVNAGDGGMVDYDWVLYDRPDFWTHRSRSTVDVDYGFDADLRGAYRFLGRGPVTLAAMLGIRSIAWKWTDHGVDYSYSTLGDPFGDPSEGYTYEQVDPTAVRDFNGRDSATGVIYEEAFLVPYVGLAVGIREGRFRADAHVTYSELVAAKDRDQHVLRDPPLVFKGTFDSGTWLAYGVSIACDLTPRLFVSAAYEQHTIEEIRGDVSVSVAGESGVATAANAAGIEHESRQATLSLGVRL